MVKIGQHVRFVDENGIERDGLVTCVHSPTYINLVSVSVDEAKSDVYGRQIDRQYTSMPAKNDAVSAGRYFFVPESIRVV